MVSSLPKPSFLRPLLTIELDRPGCARGSKPKRIDFVRTVLSASLAALLTLSVNAQATPILDFGTAFPYQGQVSWAGGSAPLTGVDIALADFVSTGTAAHAGEVQTCLNCTVSFETGDYLGSTANSWNFAGGGQITVSGQLDLDGDLIADGACGTLLSGTLDNVSVFSLGGGLYKIEMLGTTFSGLLAPELANHYLAQEEVVGGITLSFSTEVLPGQPITTTTLHSGGVTVELTTVAVPPAAWLFGSGLVGMVVVARRRNPGA